MAVAPQGHQHCGQANLLYSKPQRSWQMRALDIAGELVSFNSKPQRSLPSRALDIAGKLRTFFSKPQRYQPTRAQDIAGELCHWWQSCKRASMGQQHNHAKNGLKRRFFCSESNSMCVNLNSKADKTGHF
jgi:hypothetical protein